MSGMQEELQNLVSQAEREGVTLAEILNRELGPGDLDKIQSFLSDEISRNYNAIEEFMRDVEVPGTYDFSSMDDDTLCDLQEELRSFLSDTPLVADSGV